MQLKTPKEYANAAVAPGAHPSYLHAEKAVASALHDVIMRLCQADYEGAGFTSVVSEILHVLGEVDDPRQRKLDFGQ